jgi:curved DNA-binding protein CbpA
VTSQQSSKERVNLYLVLDLMPGASHNEILHAYNRAKNTYTGGSLAGYSLLDSDSAEGILEEIEKAYSILGNPSKRREYDLEMGYHTWNEEKSADSKKTQSTKDTNSGHSAHSGLAPVVRSRGSTIFESQSESSNIGIALTALSQDRESRNFGSGRSSQESGVSNSTELLEKSGSREIVNEVNAARIDAILEKVVESQNDKTESPSRTVIPMKAPSANAASSASSSTVRNRDNFTKRMNPQNANPVASSENTQTQEGRFEPNREFEDQIKNCSTVDGAFLRAVRVYRGFSVEALAHRTKLGPSHVMAVENEGGDMELPAPVYLRGHVFLLCQTLGLPNPQKLATGYIDRLKVQGKIKPKVF